MSRLDRRCKYDLVPPSSLVSGVAHKCTLCRLQSKCKQTCKQTCKPTYKQTCKPTAEPTAKLMSLPTGGNMNTPQGPVPQGEYAASRRSERVILKQGVQRLHTGGLRATGNVPGRCHKRLVFQSPPPSFTPLLPPALSCSLIRLWPHPCEAFIKTIKLVVTTFVVQSMSIPSPSPSQPNM